MPFFMEEATNAIALHFAKVWDGYIQLHVKPKPWWMPWKVWAFLLKTFLRMEKFNFYALPGYVPVVPEVTLDGNQWCALLGENLQEGIAGFGSTPNEALKELSHKLTRP